MTVTVTITVDDGQARVSTGSADSADALDQAPPTLTPDDELSSDGEDGDAEGAPPEPLAALGTSEQGEGAGAEAAPPGDLVEPEEDDSAADDPAPLEDLGTPSPE